MELGAESEAGIWAHGENVRKCLQQSLLGNVVTDVCRHIIRHCAFHKHDDCEIRFQRGTV